ncbi:hypothetical protein CYMTET_20255 [Cymbomonas tetramitiformis]|uniref:Glycosyltransferase n=1 Tax=Cymbomonas tetramitiformis TaxID=36881 RepID=A0AAE0G4G1_9CHLO|nr:hypothetical protein CYMTET_20255 [Cymbomonas tetramitiformis]
MRSQLGETLVAGAVVLFHVAVVLSSVYAITLASLNAGKSTDDGVEPVAYVPPQLVSNNYAVLSSLSEVIAAPREDDALLEPATGKKNQKKKKKKKKTSSSAEEGQEECCRFASPGNFEKHGLLHCANTSAAFRGDQQKVVLITMITTDKVRDWAQYSAAVNAMWAKSHGYEFIVISENHPALTLEEKGKTTAAPSQVPSIEAVLLRPEVEYVFWLDADAVMVGHHFDVRQFAAEYPGSDLIVCREANLETNNVINSGAMIFRKSEWSLSLLRAWYSHKTVAMGAPDQYVFDQLWESNSLNVQAHTKVLPATAFNSEPPFYDTWKSPQQQPVIHLMGDHGNTRRRVFQRMFHAACAAKNPRGSTSPHPPDWPVQKEWIVDEMERGFVEIVDNPKSTNFERTQALQRAGQIYGYQGKIDRRIEVLEQCLDLKEAEQGQLSPDIAHEVQVLGNLHSIQGRHARGLAYLNRALKINEKNVNPLGEPQDHLVAASLADLAAAYGRMRRYEDAVPLLNQALEIEERLFGPDHKNVGDTLHNMGIMMKLMGSHSHFKKALRNYKGSLSADHHLISLVTQRMDTPVSEW